MSFTSFRGRWAATTTLLSALTLAACGGGSTPEPEETRVQDSRQFTPDPTRLPFTAIADAPETDRWWGVLDGASYRVEVPKNWNGMLVMYAHGYGGTGPTVNVSDPPIRAHLIRNGYAITCASPVDY